jgi:hypothetical protein
VYNVLEKTFHRWVLWLTDRNKFLFWVKVNLFFALNTVVFTFYQLSLQIWVLEVRKGNGTLPLCTKNGVDNWVCSRMCVCVCFYILALIHFIDADIQIWVSNKLDVLSRYVLPMIT